MTYADVIMELVLIHEHPSMPDNLKKRLQEVIEVLSQYDVSKKWIPCSEIMPSKKYDRILVARKLYGCRIYYDVCSFSLDLHSVSEFQFEESRPGFYYYDSEWGYCEVSDVIAWKEIELYEVKNELRY